MSIIVQARHFFNTEGLKAFPALFEEHRRSVAAFPGFISLRHSHPSETEPNDWIGVTLEFENEALLKEWRSSPQHAQIAAKCRRYWTHEPEIVFSLV